MPCIVSALHANPNSRAIPEQFAEPDRNGRRDRLALAQNVMEMLAGNAQKLRNLSLGPAGRRNHIFPQQCAGMGRAAIPVAPGNMNHDYFSSVILFEVDSANIAVLEFEGDAPWSIHMDRIARWLEASQGMEIKAGDVHFLRPRSGVQAIQTTRACIFASIFAVRPFSHSSARALLLKLSITVGNVSDQLTDVNYQLT
jgi:hypothetical protein